MKIVAQIKKISVASIIIAIALGILFIVFPQGVIAYISLFIGISLILIGAGGIIGYFLDKSSGFTLTLGIISAIVGIIVCIKYEDIIKIIIMILGIFILTAGLFNMITALKIIASSAVFGWITFGLSIVTVVFGIIAITKSGELSETIVQFIGAALLVYAVVDIISFIQVRKNVKQIKSAAQSTGDIETQGTIVEESDA